MTAQPASPIAAVKQRHRLADVAGRTGLYLPSTAGTLTVRCPMPAHGHPDRTPSMRLYLDDDRYYCFGCGSKGDIVQWVQDAEAVSVTAAIRALDDGRKITNAWPVAVSLPNGRKRSPTAEPVDGPSLDRTSPTRVRDALAAAWDLYTADPLHGRAATYLANRGIDVDVLEARTCRAETGSTPARGDGIVSELHARGFSTDELVDAGLASRHQGAGRVFDFYRQRVLIPVRDDEGRVVGLIGRNVGDQSRWAKYNNPPRTVVYDKSVNLYQPLPPPARTGQMVVVEGSLDALAIAVAAVRIGQGSRFCPVTQSGRELSDGQVRQILRLHRTVVLGFDADPSGQDAQTRYAHAIARRGRAPAVSRLPEGHDPASWLAACGDSGLGAWDIDWAPIRRRRGLPPSVGPLPFPAGGSNAPIDPALEPRGAPSL